MISEIPANKNNPVVAWNATTDTPLFYNAKRRDSCEYRNGVYIPVFMPNSRFTALIVGNAGSGKTTLAKNMIKTLQSLVEMPSFLVTPLEEIDPSFKGAKLKPLNPSKAIHTVKSGIDKYNADMRQYRKLKIAYRHKKAELEPENRLELEKEIEDSKPERSDYDFSTMRTYTPIFKRVIKEPSLLVFEDADSLKGNKSAGELLTEAIVHGRHDDINLICILHRPVRNSVLTANIHECDMIVLLTANKLNLKFLAENFGDDLVSIFKDLLKSNRYVCYIRSLKLIVAENVIVAVN